VEALSALVRIGPERDAVFPVLRDILRAPKEDEALQILALDLMQRMDLQQERTLPILDELFVQRGVGKRLLEAVGDALEKHGERGVPALTRAVQHGNHDAALVAIRSLGRIGLAAQAALPALREAAQEEDPDIREAARFAIGCVDRRR
jgi:hypothetical protein